MSSCVKKYFIVLFALYGTLFAQNENLFSPEYYEQGMKAIQNNKYEEAENYFEKSIDEYEDASSYYQLALINIRKDTPVFRAKALRLLKKSIWKDPDNITYRHTYAGLMEDFAKFTAISQYEKILEIDNSATAAWIKLGDIKRKEFDEYYNSVRKLSEEIDAPLDEYALEDFSSAEYYYKKALETDPENTAVLLNLALLFERKDSLDGSIFYLKKLVDIDPASKDARLYLGLCYNLKGEYQKAHSEYSKAVALMGTEEKKEFTYTSVLELINPVFENLEEVENEWYLDNIINAYWKINDPLFDNSVNERLLEHYTRVAYANLRFTPKSGAPQGWKTDRGKTVLRYGIPLKKVRYRPAMTETGIMMKTEIWNYEDMVFGFTDQFSSGDFAYSAPMGELSRYASQFEGDSHTYADQLKNVRHQVYNPPFRGERFEFEYDISQFRNLGDENTTDYVITYKFHLPDSSAELLSGNEHHKWSVDFFNKFFESTLSVKGAISDRNEMAQHKNFSSNTILFASPPDSGTLVLKLYREYDKAYSSLIEQTKIRSYVGNDLQISDLLFARNVAEKRNTDGLQRNNFNIIPSTGQFSNDDNIYIYYEIYNLLRDGNGLTDFTVDLELKREDGFTIFSRENSVVMSSTYKTKETSPQISLQLDLTELQPGKYSMKVKVHDTVSGKISSSEKEISIIDPGT